VPSVFAKGLVGVAIEPAFAGLGGGDDGMRDRVGVLAGVAMRRAVAAESRPALLTRPEVNPLRADLHAFGAFKNLRLFDGGDRIEVRAAAGRHAAD